MIKRICICSRCGKKEENEICNIKINTKTLGPIAINCESVETSEKLCDYILKDCVYLCGECKEEFDKFMKNEKGYIIPEELMSERALRGLAVEGCPEEFDLPQVKTVCEEAKLDECVECFKKSINLKKIGEIDD